MCMIDPKGRRILVVDDDPSVGAALEQILRMEGYRVTRVWDGQAALDSIAADAPDLILLDVNMPKVSGFEDARVKADPATSLLPIVIVTGESEFEARLQAWDVGQTISCRSHFRLWKFLLGPDRCFEPRR